jgi:hypothetical protein
MRSTAKIAAFAAAAVAAPMVAFASPAAAEQQAATVRPAAVAQSKQQADYPGLLTRVGLTVKQLLENVTKLLKMGYAPQSVSVSDALNPKYSVVWIKDKAKAAQTQLVPGLKGNQLLQKIAEMAKNGYSPLQISATGAGANAVFAVIFQKSAPPAQVKIGLTKAQFQALNAQLNAAGLVILSLNVYGTPNEPLYAGIWTPLGKLGEVRLTMDKTVEQHAEHLKNNLKQGLELLFVTIGPDGKLVGGWVKKNGDTLQKVVGLNGLGSKLQLNKL